MGTTIGLPWFLSPALALDADNDPYVAFTDFYSAALRLAYWQENGWQFETVDDDEQGGWYPSLALGSDGQPQISYYLYTFIRDFEIDDLRYASRGDEGWEPETIDYNIRRGANAYLRLDQDDHPHIVYLDWDLGLRYAWRDDTGWHMEVVPTTGSPGAFNLLGLDEQGRLHITYVDTQADALMVAYRGPSHWQSETVSTEHGHCTGLAGALDARGRAHIACTGEDLLYIYAQTSHVYLPLVVCSPEQ